MEKKDNELASTDQNKQSQKEEEAKAEKVKRESTPLRSPSKTDDQKETSKSPGKKSSILAEAVKNSAKSSPKK